jgi:DnaJ-class molecular chaperone
MTATDICPRCGGTGTIRRLDPSDYSTAVRKCSSCDGTGKIIKPVPVTK